EKDLGLFDRLKRMGFDGLEIFLNHPESLPMEKIKEKMNETGMGCTLSVGLGKEQNLISPDSGARDAGVAFLKEAVDVACELGSDVVSGVIYAAWGEFTGKMRTEDEWNYSKECLLKVAEYTEGKGVMLALEPVNRFETYFLNTIEDTRKMVEEINHPNVGIHADTFHMNIEEESFYGAIKMAGEHLCHVHLCENNRGIPGTGHIPWDDVFRALRELSYDRWAVVESFVPAVEEVARMTAIWRQLAPSADVMAEEGLKLYRSKE
ncbi:sugar phosphate isomerase/epimerase, partial [Candidatus Aerophobetes bacterium]